MNLFNHTKQGNLPKDADQFIQQSHPRQPNHKTSPTQTTNRQKQKPSSPANSRGVRQGETLHTNTKAPTRRKRARSESQPSQQQRGSVRGNASRQ
ncbi:MAG: hypothetical protein K8963_07800, partial [Proteobacteria bacterium]|nr:hypothetical protein [Pseudomonadota bacterium]